MQKNILITGKPKSGKSTLLRTLLGTISHKVGFITNEIIEDPGHRVGFEIETHAGHRAVLAHVSLQADRTVSKYFVDTKGLDLLIPEVSCFKSTDLLYLDEVGQMQLFSERFKELVLHYLNSSNTCLITLSCIFEDGFIQQIKKRDDSIVVEISPEDREEKERFISQLIAKIEKAKNYSSEPERLTIQSSSATLRSEHGIRKLIFINGAWECSCNFYKRYGICSHIIATKEILRNNHSNLKKS